MLTEKQLKDRIGIAIFAGIGLGFVVGALGLHTAPGALLGAVAGGFIPLLTGVGILHHRNIPIGI